MYTRSLVLAFALCASVGCDDGRPAAPAPPGAPAAPGAAPGEPPAADGLIDNPEYASWARYKPGTVVRKRIATSTSDDTYMDYTITLAALTPQRADIDVVLTYHAQGTSADSPVSRQVIDARVPAKPSPLTDPSTTTGEETLTVDGRAFKTVWTRTVERKADQTTTVTIWTSDEFPGRQVRIETKIEGSDPSITRTNVVRLIPAP